MQRPELPLGAFFVPCATQRSQGVALGYLLVVPLALEDRSRRVCVHNVANYRAATGFSSCQRHRYGSISRPKGRRAIVQFARPGLAVRISIAFLKNPIPSSRHSTDSLPSRHRSGIRGPATCLASIPNRKILAWVLKNGWRCLR